MGLLKRPRDLKKLEQLLTVDHLARGSMKTAANCVSKCELQDTLSIDRLNAHCVHGHRAVGTLGRGWVQIKNRTSAVPKERWSSASRARGSRWGVAVRQ